MKKIYLSIFATAFMLSANAQLSLTKTFNEPLLGDVNTKQGYDSVAVLPTNTGSNQVWNFSALTTNTVVDVITFKTVASTPNGANYPSATIADDDGQGAYDYYKSTATQYELVGIEDPTLILNLSNTAIVAIWPVAFGYTNTDVFSGTAISTIAGSGTATGTITTAASGTGTLIIPGGASFTNVLQVIANQRVNVSLLFGSVTATLVSTDYNYYHGSQKFPLLTVSYSNISGSFTSTSASVKVNSSVLVTGINDVNFDANFSIFPNPAKNNFNVKLNNIANATCKIEIINAMGQIIQTHNLGNDSEILSNVSISNLSTGVYFVKTTLGDKVSNRKLIVE
jgi:hypothetical protein